MDTAALLQSIYRACREKRLADVLSLLSDEFKFTVHLPEDALDGGARPRSKAETALLLHDFMKTYDFLLFEPGPIIVTDDRASAQPEVRFRHKKTGNVLEAKLVHSWRVEDGKARALEERHDVEELKAFAKSINEAGA